MRRFILSACALVGAAAISGCADMITGGPLIRPGEPTGAIEVINGSSQVIHAVLISNCDASTYGLNRLPEGLSIPQGSSYTFEVSAGCWDVDAGSLGYGEARQRMTIDPGVHMRYTVGG